MHPATHVGAGLTRTHVPTVLSVLIAGLLAVTSLVGLVWGQQGLYRADRITLPAFLGQDVLMILVTRGRLGYTRIEEARRRRALPPCIGGGGTRRDLAVERATHLIAESPAALRW